MHAREPPRVEPRFERSQRFAEQMALRANVQANIVIIGANTIDLRLRRCDTLNRERSDGPVIAAIGLSRNAMPRTD
jgi:hypothetical protein